MPLPFVSGARHTVPAAAVAPSGSVTSPSHWQSAVTVGSAGEVTTGAESIGGITGTHTLRLQWTSHTSWTDRQAQNDIRVYVAGALAATLTSGDSFKDFEIENGQAVEFKWTPTGTGGAIAEWDCAELINTSDSDAYLDTIYFAWLETAPATTFGNKHFGAVGEQNHVATHWPSNQISLVDQTSVAARTGGGGSTYATGLSHYTGTPRRWDTESFSCDGTEDIILFSYYLKRGTYAGTAYLDDCQLIFQGGAAGYWQLSLGESEAFRALGGWNGGAAREATFLYIDKPDANGWFRIVAGVTDVDNGDALSLRTTVSSTAGTVADYGAFLSDFMINQSGLSDFEVAS